MGRRDDGDTCLPPWGAAVLVCRKCGKRSEGGGKKGGLTAKAVRAAFERALEGVRPRVRVLSTGCQKVCPKGVYVSCVGPGGIDGAVVVDTDRVPGLVARFLALGGKGLAPIRGQASPRPPEAADPES